MFYPPTEPIGWGNVHLLREFEERRTGECV